MRRIIEFNPAERPDDGPCVAAIRMAVLTTALACHDAEGLSTIRRDLAESTTSGPWARSLDVDIHAGDAIMVLVPYGHERRARDGAKVRVTFDAAEVRAALAMIPPHRFGRGAK